jgi:ABC-2 type transport system permease protein
MMDALHLYRKFVGIAIRSRMEYRSDFIVGSVSVISLNVVNLSIIWVLVSRFRVMAGWSFWEIVMLYATFLLGHSLYAVLFWHLSRLEEEIIRGRLDQYLVRPVSPLLQFLGSEVNYMGLADLVLAIAIFALAYRNLDLRWSPGEWAFFGAAVLSGTAIETAIMGMIGFLSFWTGRSRSLLFLFWQFTIMNQQYPMEVFGTWFRIFITGFLPVSFMNYHPLTRLLHKPDALGIPALGFLSPVVAMILLALASLMWQQGLAGYTSSGN